MATASHRAFGVVLGSMLSMPLGNRICLAVALLGVFVATGTNAAEVDYIPPVPVVFKEPAYPVNSVATGTVVIVAIVERDGQVSEAKVAKSVVSLDEPSVRAAKLWRFEPARLGGQPIRSKASISFVYDRGLFLPGRPKK